MHYDQSVKQLDIDSRKPVKKKAQQISILAQTSSGQFFDHSIRQSGKDVAGIDNKLGLMILARGPEKPPAQFSTQHTSSPAYKSVEILLDDMQLNLPEIKKASGKGSSDTFVTQCLMESIENINDYLYAYNSRLKGDNEDETVALTALQIASKKLCLYSAGDFRCYQVNQHELINLNVTQKSQKLLGKGKKLAPKFIEHELSENDILILTTDSFLNHIGAEFVQTTLSRFSDNLEMAFRQLNSRASRIGLVTMPTIILCQILTPESDPLNWLKKLGIR